MEARIPPYSKEGRRSETLSSQHRALFGRTLDPAETTSSVELLNFFVGAIDSDYLLAYGTLLGALLYRGFIPWDDDMDVLCRKNDYDRIKQACLDSGLAWHDSYFSQDGESVVG